MQSLPVSPLSPVDILSRGLALGASGFGRLLLVTTALAVLGFLPTVDVSLHLGNAAATPEMMLQLRFTAHQAIVQTLSLLAALLPQAVAVARLGHIAAGVPADYRNEVRRGVHAYPAMLGALLLSLLIGALAMALSAAVGSVAGFLGRLLLGKQAFLFILVLCLVVMAFYVFIYLVLVQYCIVLEGAGPVRAINRSFNLVYGRWWHTFLVLLLTVLCVVVASIALAVTLSPLLLAGGGEGTGRGLFVTGVCQMVVTALSMPFFLAVLYMLYHDLRLRAGAAA